MNFDDLFADLELALIMKMDTNPEQVDPQSISNIILSYAKTENGSEQFYLILESFILQNQHKFSTQELANIIYSYHKSPSNCQRLL